MKSSANPLIRTLRILLVVNTVALCGCTGEKSSEALYASAQESVGAGDSNTAILHLKNLLQQSPDDPRARILLGQIYFDQGNLEDAQAQLERARKLGVGDELVLPLLARTLSLLGSYDELRSVSLGNLTPPAQATVLAAQGIGELARGQIDQAEALIDDAMARDPKAAYVVLAKIQSVVAQSLGDLTLAREMLEELLQERPDYAPAWSLLGAIEQKEERWASAEQAYDKALGFDANVSRDNDLLQRAMVRVQMRNYEAAQKDVSELTKRHAKSPGVQYAQGLIYFFTQRYTESVSAFEIAQIEADRYPDALLYQGISHLALGNYEQAQALAERFHSRKPNDTAGRKFLAVLRLSDKRYADTESLVRPLVADHPDDLDALNILGNSLAAQGKRDEAIDILSKVADIDPNSASAQTRLGVGLIWQGDRERGLEHLKSAMELNTQIHDADVLLAMSYLSEKNFEAAIATAEASKKRDPNSASTHILAGKVYLAAGKESAAIDEFQSARTLAPGEPVACLNLAAISLKKDDRAGARKYLEEILQHDANHMAALMQMAVLDGVEGDEDAMLQRLRQAASAHPKNVEPRLVLARYFLAHGKMVDAAQMLNELDEAQRSRPDVLRLTALYQLAQRDFHAAKLTLERAIRIEPAVAETHHQLAEAYAGANEKAKVLPQLQRAVELAPDDYHIRLAIARWSLQSGDLSGFAEHYAALERIAPTDPGTIELKLIAEQKQGKVDDAESTAQQLYQRSPNTKNMLRLAHIIWDSGNHEKALRLLNNWINEHPEDITAEVALANLYSLTNRDDEAIGAFNRILANDGRNVVALNGLAWHMRKKDPIKALEYARRALALRPASPEIMDTLALVLMYKGDTLEARQIMDRLLAIDAEKPAYKFHSMLIDAAAGRNTEGMEISLQRLLDEEKLSSADRADAVDLLAKLKK